ncbi:UNKNOWN [Stylonychia lemnae]|uniref:Arrestin-like N-terminal domain-containing protein n=1 Tax=Stylonychia lemnae TaxID=5949 RepID=A0A078AEU5_STYLE|nr:UNKNOWN [Stylonychia lemnae]|eukprot:CDW79403.1 UNKNOWN [Stylonychia lemnae]
MGNVDSRCKHEHGYLMVQTAKQIYYPGEVVTGTVYLRTHVALEVSYIELEVQGKEKVSFVTREHRDNEWHHDKHKSKKILWQFKQPCFTFSVPTLAPGDYAVPFSFALPPHIPSSLYYKNKHIDAKPKACVKYQMRASLIDHHHHSQMKYKTIMVIREHDVQFEVGRKTTSELPISTWCCINQGQSRIEVDFEKNVFEPHEVCRANVNLDNSRCNVRLTNVRLAVEQVVRITAGWHTFNQTFTLSDKHEAGVPANHSTPELRHLELPLSSITYQVEGQRKKGGHMKSICAEDLYMMKQMQPACHGHHITNEYFLAVRCGFEGCTCCATLPHARIPISIVPVVNPQFASFSQPTDFAPQYYQQYDFQVKMQ